MSAPQKIHDLVELFERNADTYRSPHYNEAAVRQEFINPFFKSLGWDMDNERGFDEAHKQVIHEAAIKVGGVSKAPDYCFRIGGTREFFLEAKKPAVNIDEDPAPAYQLRRYAWNASLPISILTNFEGFVVYDCRRNPDQSDSPAAGRFLHLMYREYVDRWDEIAGNFSPEAINKGALKKFVESKKLKGTVPVDKAFLEDIESWRVLLAKNMALRNPKLTQRQLNFAVQMTIDRIIFLRMCEDRGIEPPAQLMALLNGTAIYGRLLKHFRDADDRYNSGLFHFHKEKDRDEDPDELTPGLTIDDHTLKEIFEELYEPHSPYEFSVLPAEILGQVYEQFLGKVIRLTAGHQAKVEDKPEVKKAGGVYYTPTYIVDYIVKHTVGKLLEGKTPVQAAKLTILDPACGSGSFLLGAYQYLLDWHRDWYIKDGPAKHTKELYEGRGGFWRLTTTQKKRILHNNIYGVDIDPQAVEVTKLSLLLKVLEGESQETLESQRLLFHERALPDLASNIKCGNSLIGPDFYQGRQTSFLDEEEKYRINAFDWNTAFPKIMKGGGFDVVIGNPPYIRIQTMQEINPEQAEHLKTRYSAAGSGNYDIYVVFVEKGLSLLNATGRLGYILPSKFFATDYGQELRRLITRKRALLEVVDFSHAQVFDDATTYTCLLFLSGKPTRTFSYRRVATPSSIALAPAVAASEINSDAFSNAPWVFSFGLEKKVVEKLAEKSLPLRDLPARIGRGSSSGDDDVFMIVRRGKRFITRGGQEVEIEPSILRIPIYATDFGRYLFNPNSEELIVFPYHVTTEGYDLISETELRGDFPKAFKYLTKNKKTLEARKQFRAWYSFSAPRNLEVHDRAQLLVPLLADQGLYCRLPERATKYCLMASGGFSITVGPESGMSANYVLGLLNSRLLFWRLRSISNIFRGGWITCTKQYVERLPIHVVNSSEGPERVRHDQIVGLVDQMLSLHKELPAAKTPHEKAVLQGQIDATDREVDRLVYDLYGMTEEEIKIVEESTNAAK